MAHKKGAGSTKNGRKAMHNVLVSNVLADKLFWPAISWCVNVERSFILVLMSE